MTACNVGREQRRFARYDGSMVPGASIVVVSAKTDRYSFVTSRSGNRGFFGTFERDDDYDSSAVLKSHRDQPG